MSQSALLELSPSYTECRQLGYTNMVRQIPYIESSYTNVSEYLGDVTNIDGSTTALLHPRSTDSVNQQVHSFTASSAFGDETKIADEEISTEQWFLERYHVEAYQDIWLMPPPQIEATEWASTVSVASSEEVPITDEYSMRTIEHDVATVDTISALQAYQVAASIPEYLQVDPVNITNVSMNLSDNESLVEHSQPSVSCAPPTKRQELDQSTVQQYHCVPCGLYYKKRWVYSRHLESKNHCKRSGIPPKQFECQHCCRIYTRKDILAKHVKTAH
ncbi:hypothetical protein EC973_008732 [Apophysomyces ossiformis]|uniref:C2H2-type domain-containing protein n=1 Tax=Apophysomyces ossiformis TaxID=679940 RepID=A0A8H7ENX8_9FUNG|nr:hypothetical protein EC973_008732 [Apophysomyces ossiformis]